MLLTPSSVVVYVASTFPLKGGNNCRVFFYSFLFIVRFIHILLKLLFNWNVLCSGHWFYALIKKKKFRKKLAIGSQYKEKKLLNTNLFVSIKHFYYFYCTQRLFPLFSVEFVFVWILNDLVFIYFFQVFYQWTQIRIFLSVSFMNMKIVNSSTNGACINYFIIFIFTKRIVAESKQPRN